MATETADRETATFARSKFGLIHDPRGAHVVMAWQGRELLGEVTGCRYDDVTGCARLTVRHFNGEAWPIDPAASAVRVLIRRS